MDFDRLNNRTVAEFWSLFEKLPAAVQNRQGAPSNDFERTRTIRLSIQTTQVPVRLFRRISCNTVPLLRSGDVAMVLDWQPCRV